MGTFSFGRTRGELVPSTYRSQRGFVRLCEISTGLIYQRLGACALLQVNVVFRAMGYAMGLRGPTKQTFFERFVIILATPT